MTNSSYERTPEGYMRSQNGRVKRLEHRLPGLPARLVNLGSGSTVERDARYGDPALFTDPEKVALAERKVVWFNTDLGWQESYYVVTGLGATVPQLLPGTLSGWYPISQGPWWRGRPNAGFATTAGSYVRGWGDAIRTIGGTEWFTYEAATGGLQLHKAGVYRVTWQSTIQPGTGQLEFYSRILDPTKTTVIIERPGNTTTLSGSLYTQAFATLPEYPIAAGQWLFLLDQNGSANIHQAAHGAQIRGNLSVEYIGPHFA